MTQRVHSESFRSTAAPAGIASATDREVRIFNAVNDAWVEVQSEREWRWMRATLDATLTVDQLLYTAAELGADRFGRWRFEDDDYSVQAYLTGQPNTAWSVRFRQLDEFRAYWIYRQMGSSQPIEWSVNDDDSLYIGPAPALDYNLRIDYWKEPSELLADEDTPDMPARFHMLLVWRALQEVAKSDAAPEVLARADMNYRDMHDKLLRDQARLPHL